jgi:chemotaxis protein MotB
MINPKRYKRKKKVIHVEEGDGNWLISYADMMTLLWGFFVILNAYSVPNKAIMEKLKESTSKAMGGEYKKPNLEFTQELTKVFEELKIENESQVESTSDEIKITLKSGSFFDSGSSELPDHAKIVLEQISNILKKRDKQFRILIEGHTDDVRMKRADNFSNWELSSNRANSVVKFMESSGIRHESLRPIGYADVEPLIDPKNLTDEKLANARSQNRRIVIRLQKIIEPRLKNIK